MSVEDLQPSYPEITLPKACLTLPPDCQEGVRDVLNRLQRMKEEGSWFKVRTPEELNLLIPQVQEHAKNIFDGLRQYKNADNSWDAALNVARGVAREAVWYAARNAFRGTALDAAGDAALDAAGDAALDAAWYAAGEAAREAVWNAAGDAARDAAGNATWEVIKDLSGFEINPFSPLLSLYELGSAGIKFHRVEETNEGPKKRLIVHFPLKLEDDRPVLACLAFPDGRTGDETVQYIHSWQDPCSEITLLNALPQREIK